MASTKLRSAVFLAAMLLAAGVVQAVDGIAISAHRKGPGDPVFGVGRSMFGDLVRHDINEGKTVKSRVIYAGKARAARINTSGRKVAFIKLDGRLCVMNIDGTGLKELTNAKNHNGTAVDWPAGDWLYYTQEDTPPEGGWKEIPDSTDMGWGERVKQQLRGQRLIRRINVITGQDEPVGHASHSVWQLSLTTRATKGSGKFAITGALLDFSNPSAKLNWRGLPCGVAVSPSGRYVCEMTQSHADLRISDWGLRNTLIEFNVDQWLRKEIPGRRFFYRPRWSVNSDKWIVLTNGSDSNATKDANMILYNWKGGEQIQVTGNAVGTGENDEGEDFWVAGVANDFAPGGYEYEGEAPFALEFTSDSLEGKEWRWSYGDGTEEKAVRGRHTFEKAGRYKVTAKRADLILRQTVNVLARRAPSAAVSLLDSTHLIVDFDEPVRYDGVSVSLASGTAVRAFRLERNDRKLFVTLGKSLPRSDTLVLEGIVDKAQVPNALGNPRLPIAYPDWPSDRSGLAFLWETEKTPSIYSNAGGNTFRPVSLIGSGSLLPDRFGAMSFRGGAVFAPGAEAGVTLRCAASNELTVEATITPASRQQNPKKPAIVFFINWHWGGWGNANFALYQQDGKLWCSIRNKAPDMKGDGGSAQRAELCTLAAGKANHVVIAYTRGVLTCYLDGVQAKQSDEIKGTLSWERPGVGPGIHFGGVYSKDNAPNATWRGKIEGIAIYARAMSAKEVAANHAAYTGKLNAREVLPRLEVRATLAAVSPAPKPTELIPYTNALVVYEYDVEEVLRGSCKQKKLRVVHWGVLDLQKTPITSSKMGSSCRLVLEPFSGHPELEGQFIKDTLPEDLDRPLYFDAGL